MGAITGTIDWLVANVGTDIALGFAVMYGVLMTALLLAQRKRTASVRAWFGEQFAEYNRELDAARASKSSAEADAERYANKIDELRGELEAERRRGLDLRGRMVVPEGSNSWRYMPGEFR